tara:strand:+ start:420 stop:620 length:201 start_codon:yes stop_codon:yes gene_type:complete
MSQVNVKLTPIQSDYNKLLAKTEALHQSAVSRLQQNRKEVMSLHEEASKLDDIITNTKDTINTMKL